uniref:Uncharacterized protein n=1 Tax=Panagrolaimus superbus TaxID=310955 RepID=A0A914Y8H4_9BILA
MKDLHSGDAHFIENIIDERESKTIDIFPEIDLFKDAEEAETIIQQKTSVMLLIAQTLRDRHRMILNESTLKRCFKVIADFGLTRTGNGMPPSIHMAMIWFGLPNLNEKIVCNLIVKELCQKGYDVYIYHYTRNRHRRGPLQQPQNLALKTPQKSPKKSAGGPPPKRRKLTVAVVNDDEEEEEDDEAQDDSESEQEFSELSEDEEEEEDDDMDLDLTESEEEPTDEDEEE